MTYSEFVDPLDALPRVQFSETESKRSGMSIGRLNCGLATDWEHFDPIQAIEESEFDLVVMRYPAQVAWLAEVVSRNLPSWSADTLIYFSLDAEQTAEPDPTFELVPADNAMPELQEMVASSFRGYTNHYASNSYLADVDVVDAYTEWTLRQAGNPSSGAYVLRSTSDEVVGFTALDVAPADHNEWLIAGVHPRHRGGGVYSQIIRHMAQSTRKLGKAKLVTSTQASNTASMRGFCREGFLPDLSLNTLHVMPKIAQESRREYKHHGSA